MTFRRQVSARMLTALERGPLGEVVAGSRSAGCDVRLHGREVHIYSRGNCVAALTLDRSDQPVLAIHPAYVEGIILSDGAASSSARTVRFVVDHPFLSRWSRALPAIIARAEQVRPNPEGEWEASLIAANPVGSSVEIIDRQVRRPRDPERRRLDLLGLGRDHGGQDAVFAIEIKRQLDNRIQDLPQQVNQYVRMLTSDGDGLCAEIADSYHEVLGQMHRMGWDAPASERLRAGMPVCALVVLAAYRDASELLDRAHVKAAEVRIPVYWTRVERGACQLPPNAAWGRLGCIGSGGRPA